MLSSCDNVKSEVCNVTTVFRALCAFNRSWKRICQEKKIRYHYDFFLFKIYYTTNVRSDIAEFFKDNAHFLPNEVTLGLDIVLSCLC